MKNTEHNVSDKKGIIYVDDDNVSLMVFKSMFDGIYNVYTTSSPETALKFLSQDDVHAIISDYRMPETNGIELLSLAFKKSPEKGRLLITSDGNLKVVQKAINIAQINQFISKPWEKETLKFSIDKILEFNQLKTENIHLNKRLEETIKSQKKEIQNKKKALNLNKAIFTKLNASNNFKEGYWEEGIQELNELIAKNMEISRVSIWTYDSVHKQGKCIDMYSLLKNVHKKDYTIDEELYSGVTQSILDEWLILEKDVEHSESSKLPSKEYLEHHHIKSLVYIPFYMGSEIYGILSCEHQQTTFSWSNEDIQILNSLTDYIKLLYKTYERRLVEEELKEAYDKLKKINTQLILSEKMASLGQLTAGIAHEINNPITFVYAGINALDKDIEHCLKITEAQREMESNPSEELTNKLKDLYNRVNFEELTGDIRMLIKDIREGANRTTEIVKGLKNFSRLDEAERKIANIHDGIDSTLVLLKSKMDSIEIIKDYDDKLEALNLYHGQLNQVFMNLLSNSIQAIGNDDGKIYITSSKTHDNLVVKIKDTGCGMSEDVRLKIFNPFFTTKDIGVGTGLGLSISFSIIEKHNGSISVQSKIDEGTQFTIVIPINGK